MGLGGETNSTRGLTTDCRTSLAMLDINLLATWAKTRLKNAAACSNGRQQSHTMSRRPGCVNSALPELS